MKPIKFRETNSILEASAPIKPLPVFRGDGYIISCWKLDWIDRMRALFGGKVWLSVKSNITTHPVHLRTDTPFINRKETVYDKIKHWWLKPMFVWLFIMLSAQPLFSQEITYNEFKKLLGIIGEMSIVEGLVQQDSNGVWYSSMKTEAELQALYQMYADKYIEVYSGQSKDIYYGSGWSAMSGIGLGMLESHAFGYQYPSLNQDGWLQNWLTMDTSGDQLIKVWHPNKLGREINDVFDRLAYERLETYYGKWYWAYLHHFVVKNTTSTMYRGWAKYGKPFYYFYIEFDLDWFLYRVFGVGQ